MNLFGIGALEILFILIIALIFIGPKDIGKHARSAGRFLNRFYRSDTWRLVQETSRNLRSLPNRLAREAALEELEEIKRSLEDSVGELNQVQQRIEQEGLDLIDASKAVNKPDINHTQESQEMDEDFLDWTTQGEEPDPPKRTSPRDEAQDNETDR